MPGLSTARKDAVLATLPATEFVQLHGSPAGPDCSIDVLGGGVRAQVTLAAAATVSGWEARVNTTVPDWPTFTALPNPAIATDFSLWTAASSGSPIGRGPLGGFPPRACSISAGTFTSNSSGFGNGYRVEVYREPGSTLPAGLTEDTRYWVGQAVGADFQLFAEEALTTQIIPSDGNCRVIRAYPWWINDGGEVSIPVGLLVVRAV